MNVGCKIDEKKRKGKKKKFFFPFAVKNNEMEFNLENGEVDSLPKARIICIYYIKRVGK